MSANTTGGMLFKIDDADPRLVYGGNWFTGGVPEEWSGTTHGTRTKGASVTFVFNGTFVAAYGTVDRTGTKLQYTLDATSNTQILPPAQHPQYTTPLLQADHLPPGEHTLVVSCAEDGATLWLDYLDFFGEIGPPLPSIRMPQQPASNSGASPVKIPPGFIALAVVGSVFVLLGIIFICLYLYRHWHRVKLGKPKRDGSANGSFEIMPSDLVDGKPSSAESTMRIKWWGAKNSPSRTQPGAPTAPPQSSTLFTSVILSVGGPPSSSDATSRV